VRSFVVVLVAPELNAPPCFPEICEPARVEAFVAEFTVKAFGECVLHRLPRLDIVQSDAAVDAPGKEVPRSEFTAVVHAYAFRSAALEDNPVKRPRHALTRQTGIDFQSQTFARERINDRQHADRATTGQAVVNEVDGPLLIGCRGFCFLLPNAHQTFALPALHAEAGSLINAEHAFVVDYFAVTPEQNAESPIAVPRLLLRQIGQLSLQRKVFFFVPPVAEGGSCNACKLAGFAFGRGEGVQQIRRVRAPVYELSPFFISRAFSISLSRASSATSFFSLPFSSSRWRSFIASFGSMPPYFAFQE
jgi:hypothetical protein